MILIIWKETAMSSYPKNIYNDYPQEKVDGSNEYRCQFCKLLTSEINGKIGNHALNCQYRRQHTYFEIED